MNTDKKTKYFKLTLELARLFSKDPHTKVGCIILRNDTILSTGVNGFPRKVPENEENWERPRKYLFVTHAEANAIANSARDGISIFGGTAFITMFPCHECSKIIIQSGISSIYCPEPDYSNERWCQSHVISLELLVSVGINIEYYQS